MDMTRQDGPAATRRPQLVITVNGPGEISAWLWPLTVAVKRLRPDLRICVCLLPCVFSSGAERGVLEAMESVDAVADVREGFGLILKNRLPEGFSREAPTLLFHLGGETALTLLIARRLGCPVWGYAEGPLGWGRRFGRLFFSGLNPLPPALDDPSRKVGDLMVDAARLRRDGAPAKVPGQTIVGLFPGSRAYMVTHFLPFLAAAAETLSARRRDLRFVMAKSDFIDWDALSIPVVPTEGRDWQASAVRLERDGDGARLRTEQGTVIDVLTNAEVLAQADVAVSLPGTNTGEMGASGLPPVVVIPMHMASRHARQTPLPGLPGHVGRIPLIGVPLQRFFAKQALKNTPILAIPSRRVGHKITPELVGEITPAEIADTVEALIDGDRAALSEALRAAMGAPGASRRLAEEIAGYFAAAPSPAPASA